MTRRATGHTPRTRQSLSSSILRILRFPPFHQAHAFNFFAEWRGPAIQGDQNSRRPATAFQARDRHRDAQQVCACFPSQSAARSIFSEPATRCLPFRSPRERPGGNVSLAALSLVPFSSGFPESSFTGEMREQISIVPTHCVAAEPELVPTRRRTAWPFRINFRPVQSERSADSESEDRDSTRC